MEEQLLNMIEEFYKLNYFPPSFIVLSEEALMSLRYELATKKELSLPEYECYHFHEIPILVRRSSQGKHITLFGNTNPKMEWRL